jgi:hypothetical protein
MSELTFSKVLTANDVGETKSHQAGMHIPKSMPELLSFLPALDLTIYNPSVWMICRDHEDTIWKFRYVYYNNKFHSPNGRRDEYRLSHMTKFFKGHGATSGDTFVITKGPNAVEYSIGVTPHNPHSDVGSVILVGWNREY